MAPYAQVQVQHRPPPVAPIPQAAEDDTIGVGLAMAICRSEGRHFERFFLEHPEAVRLADARVDRDALSRWLGILA